MGFQDETWWSRFRQPHLASWSPEQEPLRLIEQTLTADDPDPKALACYGMLLRWASASQETHEKMLLRFVEGRPVSAITTQFLTWACQELEELGLSVLAMIWDNASWHISQTVRQWIRAHNRAVKSQGQGVRVVACFLPVKSPWLNPIEPKWAHAKRRIVEPAAVLTKQTLADRVCDTFQCKHLSHLAIT